MMDEKLRPFQRRFIKAVESSSYDTVALSGATSRAAPVRRPTVRTARIVSLFHNQTINFRPDWRRRKNTSIKRSLLI